MSLPSFSPSPLTPKLEPGFQGVRIALGASKVADASKKLELCGVYRVPVAPDEEGLHGELVAVVVDEDGPRPEAGRLFRELPAAGVPEKRVEGERIGHFCVDLFKQLHLAPGPGRYHVVVALRSWASDVLTFEVGEAPR